MDNNYILTLKNITKEFPGVKALDDVTINIERGTIHGLVGENGAGKSTLIKVLAGIYQPNKGEIILDGKPCRFNSPIEARRAGISVVHQEIKLAEPLSVAENMFLGNERGSKFKVDWAETFDKADSLLAEVGLKESSHTLIKDIGVGKQQLLGKADDEQPDSAREPVDGERLPLQLRLDIRIPDDRAGDQLRKHRHIRAKAHEVSLRFCIAPIHVDDV